MATATITRAWGGDLEHLADFSPQATPAPQSFINVGSAERFVSAGAGGLLAALGLFGVQRGRLPLLAAGAALVMRGATGHCQLYQKLGIDTSCDGKSGADSQTVVAARQRAKVEKSVTINKPAADLFRLWRDVKNLPKFMRHLKRVEPSDETHSRWVAEGALGKDVAWDAEITDERENEMIAWKSLPGGDVDAAGSVHFQELGHNRGTKVTVSLKYDPPLGKLGTWIPTLLGDGLESRIGEDLRDFKRLVETGEIPTTQGQPTGGKR